MKLPETAPDLTQVFEHVRPENFQLIAQNATPLPNGRYLHWNELRYREPPAGMSHEMW